MLAFLLLALNPPVSPAPPTTAVPPVLSVRTARAQAMGATVTIRAVVLNGPELGNVRYVQDADAGLALYATPSRLPEFGELRAGDSIQVTGQLKTYNGLLEMDPVASVHKLSSGRPLRTVRVAAANAASLFTEANEGRLLEITGVKQLTNLAGASATVLTASTNYLVDGLPGTLVRLNIASTGPDGLVDHAMPTREPFDLRGILSQYAPSGTGGYQLLPRQGSDIVQGGGRPLLTEEPVPVAVEPTSVTIAFTTLNPGDTRIRYGLTSQELKESRTDAVLTTRHSFTIDGLKPGTTYYVEVSSQNAIGTETAKPVPVITAGGGKRGRRGH